MGIANKLSEDLEAIFNGWSKVTITDKSLKKLIQLAMMPNKEDYITLSKANRMNYLLLLKTCAITFLNML
jgi:hypothetical protein